MGKVTFLCCLLGFIVIQAIASPRNIVLHNEIVDTKNALQAHEDDAHLARVRSGAVDVKHQYLIHVGRSLEQTEKLELEQFLGLSLNSYIPHNTFLVVADQSLAQRAASAPHVKWVGDYAPKYKIARGAKAASKVYVTLSATERSSEEMDSIVNEWRSSLDVKQINAVSANKIEVTLLSDKDASNVVDWIAERAESQFIEAAVRYESHNQYASLVLQSNNNPVQYPVYKAGVYGDDEIIGLADSGIRTDNIYFPSGKVIVDSTYGDNTDGSGHGTSVAGTIAGKNPSNPTDMANGVAYNASIYLMDIQTGTANLSPPTVLSNLFTAPYAAGVKIFALPFGADGTAYGDDARSIDQYTFANPDFLPICSAGNYNQSLSSLAYSKNCLVVGSHMSSNVGLKNAYPSNTKISQYPELYDSSVLSSFSSRGPTSDGRIKPDICSVGEGMVSASNTGTTSTAPVSGTSYAVGTAAAAAAFVKAYYDNGFYQILSLSASTIKATLINTGVPLGLTDTNGNGHYVSLNKIPSGYQGFGRIQLDSIFLNASTLNPTPGFFATQGSLTTKSTSLSCFSNLVPNGRIKATLVWTDSPAQLGSGLALVNDLDLVITNNDGIEFRSSTAPSGEFDQLNNVEQVIIENAPVGFYTVYVHGRNVPNGPQPFSVVVGGTFEFQISGCDSCPAGCSGVGTCTGGTCSCPTGRDGVDCSLTPCPSNCGGNGICDYDNAVCVCAPGFAPPDCVGILTPTNNNTTDSTIPPSEKTGISSGVLAGAVIAAFFIGAIFSVFLGGCLAVKYLEYRRDKAQKDRATKEEEMR